MDKESRRREILTRIALLSQSDMESHSCSICESISISPEFRHARTVFAYCSLPGEPDLDRLIAAHPEKQWAFPKVGPNRQLSFFQTSSMSGMISGHFGIQEPDPTLHPLASFDSADLILVPGLAFDSVTGARVGRGKGYYDRFLGSSFGGTQGETRPLVFGVCFSVQLADLEPEAHDFPMHRVVTERGWSTPV